MLSCFADSINPQVFTITASASAGSFTNSKPLLFNVKAAFQRQPDFRATE